MANTYNSLSAANKAKTLFVAVSMFGTGVSGFCKGSFGAVSVPHSGWPQAWGISQRDVVMMYKKCGVWKVYCKFSMNTYTADFTGVTTNLLTLAEAPCSSNTTGTKSACKGTSNAAPGTGTTNAASRLSTPLSFRMYPAGIWQPNVCSVALCLVTLRWLFSLV